MAGNIVKDEPKAVIAVRALAVPLISTIAGSVITTLPLIADWPAMPPFGFLMLLGWRLLRPELWPVWIGLPLGLIDDLVSGAPLGSAMSLWTMALLTLDLMDSYLLWRDYWVDWLIAAGAILLVITASIWFAGIGATVQWRDVALPQSILSILCFPATVRLCLMLDRWRLPR